MKKLLTLIGIAIALGLAWYLLSPLLLDEVVDEAFPTSTNEANEMVIDTPEHQMTQADIDAMTEEEKAKMEQKILEEMADEPDKVMNESLPDQVIDTTPEPLKNDPGLIKSGNFVDADNVHKGSGTASIYGWGEGSELLRLEDFMVTNGPDLRVYLTKEANPTKEQVKNGLEIAKLKGNIGNQNYELPFEVRPEDYKAVVIYCKPFNVIFSTATLQ